MTEKIIIAKLRINTMLAATPAHPGAKKNTAISASNRTIDTIGQ